MRLCVSKMGAVFRTKSAGLAATGEIIGTEALLRRLVELGHDVVFYGRWQGDVPGVKFVDADTSGLNPDSSADEQRELFERDAQLVQEAFGDRDPDLLLHFCGQTTGWVTLDNPANTRTRVMTLRYIAPPLALCHTLGVPRVMFCNDLRTYSREQEMATIWPETLPIGLLDQWTHEQTQRINTKKFLRRSVLAHIQSWPDGLLQSELSEDPERLIGVASHAHIGDGIAREERDRCWTQLLCDEHGALPGESTALRVHGNGWYHWSKFDGNSPVFGGVIPFEDVPGFLNASIVSPAVSYEPGYYTSKPYVILRCGCLPVLYGVDPRRAWTYDQSGRILPMSHELRVQGAGELLHRAAWLSRDELARAQLFADARRRFRPDYSVLEAMLHDWSRELYYRRPQEWFQLYGGYREVA